MYQYIMKNVKEIDVKNYTYYFFDDMITIKNLDSNETKIDEKSYKNIIYYIGYVTVKDLNYTTINSVNPLYPIFNKINGYIEKIKKVNI